mmetsp:Transcript_34396/g.79402  ORF Transcript_34396/g.79402 Transcript_34396/m.79402 type:complete len:88 (-) Transcript_34396:790-1053(-)
MNAMTSSLKGDGMLFITHPLGASFVRELYERDAFTVPHELPSEDAFRELVDARTLKFVDFVEAKHDGEEEDTTIHSYFASAVKKTQR